MAFDFTAPSGGIHILTAPPRFGSGAAQLTGAPSGRPFSAAPPNAVSAALTGGAFSSSTLTVELWVRTTVTSGFHPIIAYFNFGGILIWDAASGALKLDNKVGAVTASANIADDQWHHVASVFYGDSTAAIYLDGVRIGTGTAGSTLLDGDEYLHVGGWIDGTYFQGYMDELRVSNTARYTGTTYAVPAAAFEHDENTTGLYHFDGDLLNDDGTASPSGPTASAGPDQTVPAASTVSLDASASTGTGSLSYVWTQTAGASVSLSSTTVAQPTFVAPSTADTLTFEVAVTDDNGTDTDSVSVTVQTAAGTAPVITTETLGTMTHGVAFSQTLTATGTTPINWSVTAGALPTGLTLSSAGVLSGTPANTGTGSVTVSATNTEGSDTQVLTWTVGTADAFDLTDPNILWTPSSWFNGSTSDIGAGLQILTDATTFAINFSWIMPQARIATRLNRQAWQFHEPASSISVPLSGEAVYDRNIIEVRLVDLESNPAWGGPALTVSGFSVDSSATTYPITSSNGPWLHFIGDSITAGMSTGSDGHVGYTQTWTHYVEEAFDAQASVQAYANRGISATTSQGVPAAPLSWDMLWDGQARTFGVGPDAVIVMLGGGVDRNENESTVRSGTASLISEIQTALPSTKIVFLRHTRGNQTAGIDYIEAEVAEHPDVHYIDTAGWLTNASTLSDNIHHWGWYDMAEFGPRVASKLRDILYTGAASPPPQPSSVTVWDGTTWL